MSSSLACDRLIVLGVTSSLSCAFLSRYGSKFKSVIGFTRIKEKQTEFSKQHVAGLSKYCSNYETKSYVDNGSDKNLLGAMESLLNDMKTLNVLNGTGVLYLSTEISTNVLRLLQQYRVPVLTIGSGAVVDWQKERSGFNIVKLAQSEKTAGFAKYIEGKILAERFSTATIHPGFYLPGKGDPFTGSGLHLESCEKIFAEQYDPAFDWGKSKYVTPMRVMVDMLLQWTNQQFTGVYMVGTHNSYPRWKLRELAGFSDVPESAKNENPFVDDHRYREDMTPSKRFYVFDLDYEVVTHDAVDASLWVKTNKEYYKTYKN